MTRTRQIQRRAAAVLAVTLGAAGLAVATPASAEQAGLLGAAPAARGPAVRVLAEPRDSEGGTKAMRDQLDQATRGYLAAKETLDRSKKRQQALGVELKRIDSELAEREAAVQLIVGQAYRSGRLTPIAAILDASSPEGFLDRATSLDIVAARQDHALRELLASKAAHHQANIALATEVRNQIRQLSVMAKRKAQAENALAVAGGGGAAKGPSTGGSSAVAARAPRSSDGSLPSESCSVNDPTTSGCITPRTLHAMREAKNAGFTRFVSCFRGQGGGEHPKGRACDFASDASGFGGVATGDSRSYGDRLANYYVKNASRLGVLYVIWFKRIWLPSSGWRAYTQGRGDPSSDHTNHVHLSMR